MLWPFWKLVKLSSLRCYNLFSFSKEHVGCAAKDILDSVDKIGQEFLRTILSYVCNIENRAVKGRLLFSFQCLMSSL